jgi:hypothetical protein
LFQFNFEKYERKKLLKDLNIIQHEMKKVSFARSQIWFVKQLKICLHYSNYDNSSSNVVLIQSSSGAATIEELK